MLKQTDMEETAPGVEMGQTVAPQEKAIVTPLSVASQNLARDLNSNKAAVRAVAEAQLQTMEVPALLELMAYQRRLQRGRSTIMLSVIAIDCVIFPLIARLSLVPMLLLLLAISFSGFAVAKAFSKVQKSGAMALAKHEDPSSIGELISALQIKDKDVQKAVYPSLTRLLLRLRASDAHLLGENERRILRLFLEDCLFGTQIIKVRDTEERTQLKLAAVTALEQVGDASFLPIITHWAADIRNVSDPRFHAAALACLPFLEASIARRQVAQELLRASGRDASIEAGSLLRPAENARSTDVESLLSPSMPDQIAG